MLINSQITFGANTDVFPTEVVKNEVMLFNARGDWAYTNGGPLTRDFLKNLQVDLARPLDEIVVDSRVHMLMPGWYPCIPGFHHDDVPRLRSDGQPYYPENEFALNQAGIGGERIDPADFYRSQHAMAMYGDDICPTQFALGEAEFPIVPQGETIYKVWHPVVEEHIAAGRLESFEAPMHQIVFFGDRSTHTGQAAKGNGWRFFIRASWSTDRVQQATNEIRRQVQVYMENPMEGW